MYGIIVLNNMSKKCKSGYNPQFLKYLLTFNILCYDV